jgi:NhaP-type Na+/H+ or K+/H+ antiporter
VTVATALALPVTARGDLPFPFREEVVLVALLVVIVTLVLQGLTLAPLIRRLGVATAGDARADARILQRMVTEAALEQIRRADDVSEEVKAAVLQQYESRLTYRGQVLDLVDGDLGGERAGEQLRSLLARATEAEREAVLEARRSGRVGSAAADDILFDVEARALRYGG